jgi:hypothetical protein
MTFGFQDRCRYPDSFGLIFHLVFGEDEEFRNPNLLLDRQMLFL